MGIAACRIGLHASDHQYKALFINESESLSSVKEE